MASAVAVALAPVFVGAAALGLATPFAALLAAPFGLVLAAARAARL